MQEGGGQREVSIGEVSARAFRVVLRYLYTAALPAWEELQGAGREAEDDGAAGGSGGRGNGGSSKGGQGGAGGSKGKGKGKSKGKEAAGSEDEGRAGRGSLALEVLKAADMLQAEGLLKHCLEAFRGGLTVHTAIEHLVWAHTEGPEEARGAAMAYVVQHIKGIKVRSVHPTPGFACVCLLLRQLRSVCATGRVMRGTRWPCSRRCLQCLYRS